MKKYLIIIKKYIAVSLILYIIEVVITSVILLFPGFLIDHYANGKNYILSLITAYVLIFTVYLVVCYFSNRIADYRRIKFEKSIKTDFFRAVISKDYKQFHQYDTGEYLSMQANEITEMCQGYLSPLLSVFRSFMMIIVFGVSLIFFVDLSVALFIIIFSAVVVYIPNLTAGKLAKLNRESMDATGKYTESVRNYLEAHEILDTSGRKKLISLHEKTLDEVLDAGMRFRKKNSFAMVMNGGAVEFVSIITFIIVAKLLYDGNITVGMATIAFTYSTKFMEPIYELNMNVSRVKSVKEIKEKLCHVLESSSEKICDEIGEINEIEVLPLIKRYSAVMVKIPKLQFVYPKKYLVVGENGVGKSVLLRLMMRFEEPDEGVIRYNCHEHVSVMDYINYVPQKPVLFHASYLDNVTVFGTYGTLNLEKYEALFPKEMIGKLRNNEDCRNLSGGEQQVIALLRALCSEKKILLLDEPFAAMNSVTIKQFMSGMRDIQRMIIMIAHNADDEKDKFDTVYRLGNR